jgi:hypothetical protein
MPLLYWLSEFLVLGLASVERMVLSHRTLKRPNNPLLLARFALGYIFASHVRDRVVLESECSWLSSFPVRSKRQWSLGYNSSP